MDRRNSPKGGTLGDRSEGLIALGRLVLAAASLFATLLDPPESARHAERAYFFLAGYLAYALLLIPLAWRPRASLRPLGLITHLADLAAFTFLIQITEGPASPYFLYFMFSLLSATLRWQWRGTLWTSVAALAIFASLGIHAGYVLQDPGFDLTRFAIRSVYLVVAAVMLGYLGAYEGEVRHALAVQVERSKAMDERLQLACNLHDWLLQSLAGTALQIEAARRQIETDTEAADKSLLDVERLLAAEQRALRSLIRRLQPDRPEAPRPAPGLAVALQELADRIEMQWGLRITFDIAGLGDGLPERLEEAVCSLVGEALVNAARHGHAVRARVRIRLETEGMHVIVADDGRGYPLRGSYDLRSLTEQGLGPRSLLDRVAALEGELLLRTSDSGTRIEIVLPPGSGARPEGVPGPSAADKNG